MLKADQGQKPELHLTPEIVADDMAFFAPARRAIQEQLPGSRHVLIPGMRDTWSDVLTIADGHDVDAIDGAYEGWREKEDPIVVGPQHTAFARESASWQLRSADRTRIVMEIEQFTRKKPVVEHARGVQILHLTYPKNVDRAIRMIAGDIEHTVGYAYDLAVVKRVFPSVAAWKGILNRLRIGGMIFTSGQGEGIPSSTDTVSGVDVENSSLPLFFPPHTIGLAEVSLPTLPDWHLYTKKKDVESPIMYEVLTRGADLDALIATRSLVHIVAAKGGEGSEAWWEPKEPMELPVLWSDDMLTTFITTRIGAPFISRKDQRRTWQSLNATTLGLKKKLEDPYFGKYIDMYSWWWTEAGYLPTGGSITTLVTTHYDRVLALCERHIR